MSQETTSIFHLSYLRSIVEKLCQESMAVQIVQLLKLTLTSTEPRNLPA